MKHRLLLLFSISVFLLIILTVWLFFKDLPWVEGVQRYTFHSYLMGTQITITLYSEDQMIAKNASQAAFDKINELNQIMSDYIRFSELNQLSQSSGTGHKVEVSDPLFEILKKSKWISELTDGLFDVTIGPVTKYWREISMMPEPEFLNESMLMDLLDSVGYQYMKLDEEQQTVELLKSEMQLDLGGIAKGYAADEALKVLTQFGIRSALVNVGGDISIGEPPRGQTFWNVALPTGNEEDVTRYINLALHGATVSTSGDMYRFVEIDGQRYSHILNPKTGLGTTEQIQSTVISGKGIYADALASSLVLMDPENGIELINNFEDTEAIIFMNTGEKELKWMSDGFAVYILK